ncbi:amino acid permease [soil metagenome]
MGQATRTSSGLLRVLGVAFGLALAVGGMVGSGIFRTPGAIVGGAGGIWAAAVLIAVGGVQSLLSANLWAEVSTSVPLSGGTVVVVRRAFGDTAALIAGWTDALACVASSAQLSVAGAGFLGILAPALAHQLGPTAAALTIALALVNWRGVVVGEVAQIAVSLTKALVIVGLIVVLFWLAPTKGGGAPPPTHLMTVAGLLVAYQLVYGAFTGWSGPGYFSEETKDIGRSVPRAMFWSVIGVMALYLLMLWALAHALPLSQLSGSEFPVGVALGKIMGPTSTLVLAAIALVTVVSCNNGNFLQSTRIMLATARAGYAPPWLARVNAGGTPDVALLVFTVLSAALAFTGRYELIFILMGTLNMALTALSDLAFFQLRRREPDLPRPFRALGHPLLPCLALGLDFLILGAVAISDPLGSAYAVGAVCLGVVAARLSRQARRTALLAS